MASAVTGRTVRRGFTIGAGGAVNVLRKVAATPGGRLGLLIVSGLLFVAVFAPFLAPYDPSKQDIPGQLQSPSLAHPFGTDAFGRDLLSRVEFGARIALGVAIPSVLLAMTAGLVLGITAGYFGGAVDLVLLIVIDAVITFPAVFLALLLISIYGSSLEATIAVIAVAFSPGYARVVRALVLATKHKPFVEAEQSLGATGLRITAVHVLPNIVAPLFILMAMDLPGAVAVEAGLSFLGLGVRPPAPSWGIIISQGFAQMEQAPWPVLAPSIALIITTLGFTMLGEALRDAIDPRVTRVVR